MSAEPINIVPGLAGAAPMLRVLSRFNRHQLETAAEVLIALMDLQDGDPDAETCATEDDFTPMPADIDFGPGCPLADPAEVDDEPEEDDPSGMCDEDGVNTALETRLRYAAPGCPIGDGLEQLP